eukprot:maker-scaffold1322_size48131-snap-gene-0.12 protein:Tk01355 transcript:maker-scaffold1322_size48131-snap-gene-0.12-mRNA-1 annotation:"hypothetical protein BRAFLDRAFT_225211"
MSTSGVALNSSEEAVLSREVDGDHVDEVEAALSNSSLATVFELARCEAWIREHQFQRVTLQFPDSLLQWAPQVAQALEVQLGQRISILGDTSYGECCVDEVAAEHLQADGLVHFGDACLTPTQRMPVLYIYTALPFDLGPFWAVAIQLEAPRVFLCYDVRYHHALHDMDAGERVVLCPPMAPDQSSDVEDVVCGRRMRAQPGSADTIVYCGRNLKYIQLLALTFNHSTLLQYDPVARTLTSPVGNVQKELMKRFYLIERARDAQRIGILVGTLGVSRYRDVIERVNTSIRQSGKRAYTFLVGKPNVAKLANFPEVDLYVLVACPANSLVNAKEYMQPVITPFELDVALNRHRAWTGEFQANFQRLLPGQSEHKDFEPMTADDSDVSLISGKLRTTGLAHDTEPAAPPTGQMAVQDTRITPVHQGGGGAFLRDKSWTGLEQKLGRTPVTKAVPGLQGVASGYQGEGQESEG